MLGQGFSWFFRRLTGDNRFQQTVVHNIAVFTNRGCPGCIAIQSQTKVRAFFHADFGKGLEAADTAVEELCRLIIQFTAQTTETVESQ